jgi:hypothetical protein
MTRAGMIVGSTLILVATETRADRFFDGNRLYALCTSPDYIEQAECVGYAEGTIDLMEWIREMGNRPPCVPHGVVGREIRDIVVDYIHDHPDRRPAVASVLVLDALDWAWKCHDRPRS